MRTTVAIDDELLDAAKRRAQREGITLGALVENALRHELSRRPPADVPELPVFTDGTGPRPGIDVNSNRALAELLDEGQRLDRLR